jgi:hypothetical protein
MSGVRDPAHIATWLVIAATIGGFGVGYGTLAQKVNANEGAIKDARPVAERIARLEANQTNTAQKVDETNRLIVQLISQQAEATRAAQDAAAAAAEAVRRAERR